MNWRQSHDPQMACNRGLVGVQAPIFFFSSFGFFHGHSQERRKDDGAWEVVAPHKRYLTLCPA